MNLKLKFVAARNHYQKYSQMFLVIPLTVATLINLSSSSAWGKDPFRSKEPRDIGEYTEEAFKTIFLEGDYKTVREKLNKAVEEESAEPLAHAMLASLAYTEKDWKSIKLHADQTLSSAKVLSETDPVRGNLYLGVGHFLAGAYIYHQDGALPAINKLQQVFKYLDKAEDADPNDPELNLIKGYMDLLLAVNLPFSSPEQAISRFEAHAAPDYLVERGLAVAYRDLKDYDRALKYVNKTLKIAPDNPEHYYLKGQILRKIGKEKNSVKTLQEAIANFDLALAKSAQLPEFVLETLKRERLSTQEKIVEINSARQS